jgi:uncharacterized protein involved in exopolysaccharide biosynthesis
MEPVAIFDILRRRALMVILLSVVATMAGYAFSFLMSDRYEVSALVLVRPQQPIKVGSGTSGKEFMDFSMGSASTVETASKTYIELIKSPSFIGEVVRELGLDKEKKKEVAGGKLIRFLPDVLKPGAQELREFVLHLGSFLKYGRAIEEDPYAKAIKNVSDSLSLKSTADTYFFELKYAGDDAQQAADVANTTAKTLARSVNDLRLSESGHQLDYMTSELEKSRQQLNAARERLENYKKKHSVFLQEKEYDAKLKVIGDLELDLAKTEATLVGSQNTLASKSLAAKRGRLIRLIDERKAELLPMPQMERELKELDQDVKNELTAYEVIAKQYTEAEIKHSYVMPEARLVSAAVPPRLPSSPQRGLIALVSLLSGVTAGIGIAVVREYLNRRVRDIEDVEDFVGVKVLATIPRVSSLAS